MKHTVELSEETADAIVVEQMRRVLGYTLNQIWEDPDYAREVQHSAVVILDYFGGAPQSESSLDTPNSTEAK